MLRKKNYSTCAELKFYSEEVYSDGAIDCTVPNTELQTTSNDVKVNVVANGTFASESQSTSEGIASSFDGNLSTMYHSRWSGNTQFPVTLNYRFDGNKRIDYLKQIPRTSGSNGRFGKVTIKYNTTSNATFVTLMDYDFAYTGSPAIVRFPFGITPLNIQILVQNGTGGYASCAEMEFYTSNNPNDTLIPQGIFADDIYSKLLVGVTQNQIDAIPSQFYKSLAQSLFNGTYNSTYRVQKYQVYKPGRQVGQELKVSETDRLENPTGMFFKAGERVVLFVRNLPVNGLVPLNLLVQNFDSAWDEDYYPLKNGMNIIDITHDGLGYMSYFNSDLTLPDVEVNIVNGTVNGYFDLKKSNPQQWPELLQSKVYSRIDVVGEYAHLVYNRDIFRIGCPYRVTEMISKYDEVIKQERLMMGLFKYNKSPKNHQMAFSDYYSKGTYAYGEGVNLDPNDYEYARANPDELSLWGSAHEFGHNNQIVSWHGMTEVTNNIYSTWVTYNMNYKKVPYTSLESSNVTPAQGIPSVTGGYINGSIYRTWVNGQHFQTPDNSGNYDVTQILIPFWQLEVYYQLAGASRNAPVLSYNDTPGYTGVDYAHWFGTLCETMRNNNPGSLTNGGKLLNFVKNTCDAVQEDLTDFFQRAGFLKPIDVSIDDYGVARLTITQQQVDDAIASIKSKGYQKPVSPVINYISALSANTFKNKLPLSGTTGAGVALNGTYLTVQHTTWQNAVAYETYDASDKLIYASISGTGDISNKTTKIYYPTNAAKVYAIGFDGQRILVYPVMDTTAPVITAPANVAVYTDAGIATASNVTLGVATATDNSGASTITNNAPATYPIGVTNVIWTAKDSAGNTATAIQTVTVTDAEAPVISAPSNQVFSFNPNGTYQVPAATATDNVNVQSINYTISGATSRNGSGGNASGQFNVGASTIDWTVTDVHGNTSIATTSVLVKGPQTLVLNTLADSFVRGGTYGNDNYGTQATLAVKNEGVNFTREVYLKFDLSTLPASFEKATLRLNVASAGSTASQTTWQASYVPNDNWTETGISWNNKPAASVVLQTIQGQNSGWAEWNITNQVLAEVGQDKILTLKITATSFDSNSNAAFTSKDSGNSALRPQLYVNVYSESAKMDGKNDVKVQIAETSEVNRVVLYPNPATNSSHLTSSAPIQGIRILNVNGQQLFVDSELSTLEYDINVENLPQGLYLVQVNGNGWQTTERLIKK